MILCSLNGLQTIGTVESMNFRILCFIKILQPLLGWQNLDRTIAYTRFYRMKGGGRMPPPPSLRPPPSITLIEWMKFKMDEIQRCSLSRWEQDSENFINYFKSHWCGGDGGTPTPPFIL